MAPVQEVWTVSATQNQNTGSGTSTRPGAIARVCSNLRFRFSLLYRSSRSSFCESFRFSLGGPSMEVTSPSATGSLSQHRAKHQKSGSSPPTSAPAKSGEVDAQERGRRATRLLVQAALWAPSMAERDMILEAIAELPDPGERVPHVGRSRRARGPAFANKAGSAALRNGTSTKLRVLEETNNIPLHITSLPSSHHVTPHTEHPKF